MWFSSFQCGFRHYAFNDLFCVSAQKLFALPQLIRSNILPKLLHLPSPTVSSTSRVAPVLQGLSRAGHTAFVSAQKHFAGWRVGLWYRLVIRESAAGSLCTTPLSSCKASVAATVYFHHFIMLSIDSGCERNCMNIKGIYGLLQEMN